MTGFEPHVDPAVQPFLGMDVYLFDQLQKGRVGPDARVLDVGAGGGRNLVWFLEHGHAVTAVEPREEGRFALEERLAALDVDRSRLEVIAAPIEEAGVEPRAFDLVVCNAVLHFADSAAHFDAMLEASFEAVAPGGLFFARLASSVGIEQRLVPLGEGRYLLPDESERYLVDDARLLEATARLGAVQLDPIKSTVVQGLRTMTTWVLARP